MTRLLPPHGLLKPPPISITQFFRQLEREVDPETVRVDLCGRRQGPACRQAGRFFFIQEMLEQPQPHLKETEITSIRTMDLPLPGGRQVLQAGNLMPSIRHRGDPQKDDPDIAQTGAHHQPAEAFRIGQMALVEVEPPAFLVGKEGFDSEAFSIPGTRFCDILYVGDQVVRLFKVS